MCIQRTICITFANDPDVQESLYAFQGIQQQISEMACNSGKPRSVLVLYCVVYDTVKGAVKC